MLYGINMLGGGRAAVLTYTMPVWAQFLLLFLVMKKLIYR